MNKLCKDCIDFFHIDLPKNAHSVYDAGKCEGCWENTLTTNPQYYLVLVEKRGAKNCASNVEYHPERRTSLSGN